MKDKLPEGVKKRVKYYAGVQEKRKERVVLEDEIKEAKVANLIPVDGGISDKKITANIHGILSSGESGEADQDDVTTESSVDGAGGLEQLLAKQKTSDEEFNSSNLEIERMMGQVKFSKEDITTLWKYVERKRRLNEQLVEMEEHAKQFAKHLGNQIILFYLYLNETDIATNSLSDWHLNIPVEVINNPYLLKKYIEIVYKELCMRRDIFSTNNNPQIDKLESNHQQHIDQNREKINIFFKNFNLNYSQKDYSGHIVGTIEIFKDGKISEGISSIEDKEEIPSVSVELTPAQKKVLEDFITDKNRPLVKDNDEYFKNSLAEADKIKPLEEAVIEMAEEEQKKHNDELKKKGLQEISVAKEELAKQKDLINQEYQPIIDLINDYNTITQQLETMNRDGGRLFDARNSFNRADYVLTECQKKLTRLPRNKVWNFFLFKIGGGPQNKQEFERLTEEQEKLKKERDALETAKDQAEASYEALLTTLPIITLESYPDDLSNHYKQIDQIKISAYRDNLLSEVKRLKENKNTALRNKEWVLDKIQSTWEMGRFLGYSLEEMSMLVPESTTEMRSTVKILADKIDSKLYDIINNDQRKIWDYKWKIDSNGLIWRSLKVEGQTEDQWLNTNASLFNKQDYSLVERLTKYTTINSRNLTGNLKSILGSEIQKEVHSPEWIDITIEALQR